MTRLTVITTAFMFFGLVGRAQTALQFNKSSNQYASVPHSPSIDLGAMFTIEAWVYHAGGANSTIVDKGNYDFLLQLNYDGTNRLGFYNRNTGAWRLSTGTVPQNTWTHVAVTLWGGTLTFYINGVASGTAPVTFTQDGGEMNIGRQEPASCQCNPMNGSIDELRIWNIARGQSQIQNTMRSTLYGNQEPGLVANYLFENNANDASGNGNHGSLVNDPGYTAFDAPTTVPTTVRIRGAVNSRQALQFNKSSNQYVSVPHSPSIDLGATFTIEAWVYHAGGANSTIVDKGNYDFLFQINNDGANRLGFYNRNTGAWRVSTGTVPQNTWTHVAVTLSGGTLTFYINGVASGTAPVTFTQDGGEMNIGRQEPAGCQCNPMNGSIDELRIWNIARTQSQIQNTMRTTLLGNQEPGLVANYLFENTANDASGNGNHGSLVNGPAYTASGTQIPVQKGPLEVKIDDLYVMSIDLGAMTWDNAVKTCSAMGNGWRLPNLTEMIMLNKNMYNAAWGQSILKQNYYWTSTEFALGQTAYSLWFGNGDYRAQENYQKFEVRAVRSAQ